MLLVRPFLVATLIWFALSVVTSGTDAVRCRFAFTLIAIGIAGMVILVPKNIRHFGDVLAAVVLIVLLFVTSACFLSRSPIHQATDFLEPDSSEIGAACSNTRTKPARPWSPSSSLGFSWLACAAVSRRRVVLPALTFLLFTQSKTSIVVLPLVLIVSSVMPRICRPAVEIAFALSSVLAFNILSIGSVYSEPLANCSTWC